MKVSRIISYTLAVMACALLLGACSSGLKAYQQGDYLRASTLAAERLRSKPNHKKAQAALANAYPLAVSDGMRRIDNALASKNPDAIEQVIWIYDDLNKLANTINTSPGALSIIPAPKQYHEEMRMAKEAVAELSYQEGLKALQYGTVASARTALDQFLRVNRYVPGYKDVTNRIAEARYAATLRVVVTRPEFISPAYKLNSDFFYTKLMAEINRRTYSRLVRFYTPEEAYNANMNDPHHIIALEFMDFTIGNSREKVTDREVKRDSVRVQLSSGQYDYITAKADLKIYRLEVMSEGVLGVRIIDAGTDAVMNHRNISHQSVWYSEWATYKGDSRALSKEQLALTQRRPIAVPPPQDLFASFADPLYAKVTDYLSSIS